MSKPIFTCRFYKAFHDETELKFLAKDYLQLIYSVIPCRCEPKCPELSKEDLKILETKINAEMVNLREERRKIIEEWDKKHPPKPFGDFVLPLVNKTFPALFAEKIVGV